jgi:methylated-DNA-[protein]-cysteine S-methyltransferase
MIRYTHIDSPIGLLLIAGDDTGIRRIGFPGGKHVLRPDPAWAEDADAFADARAQLDAYFAGERSEFDLPLAPETTPFQGRVLSELRKVPYGTTVSYGELARRVGNPRASRAVGMANGRNPIPIVIPCHRVIGANGDLTGFGGGLDTKRRLLALEGRFVSGLSASLYSRY